jgi:alpha-amylase
MSNKRELIFHAFNWDINSIIENLLNIKKANFTAIQISPIQKCKDDGNEWWKLYQPLSLSKIGNRLGTEEDLIELTKRANELDIKIIVDLVINHVAGNDKGELKPHEGVDKEILSHSEYFKEMKTIQNWNHRWQVTNWCLGALPSLRLENENLQNIIIKTIRHLVDIGVKGFRIDSCKQIKTVSEGNNFFKRIHNEFGNEIFIYGELLNCTGELIDEYSKYINVGINNNVGSDKSRQVHWTFSHDDHFVSPFSNLIKAALCAKVS